MSQKPHPHQEPHPEQPASGPLGQEQVHPEQSEAAPVELSPLEAVTAERDELRDLLLRTRAEMDNVRKRMNRERDEERRYAVMPLVAELLPAIDNLHRALAAADQERNLDALLQGMQMVSRQLDDILARHDVKAITAVGQPFDPNLHEALQQIPSADHPPMTVLQEYERGFQLHDRIIRPSKVIVSSAPASPASET